MPTTPVDLYGSEFTSTFGHELSATRLLNGSIVVSWEDGAQGLVQIFSASGKALTSTFAVATPDYETLGIRYPSVIGLNNGTFAVAWYDIEQDSPGRDNLNFDAQIYSASGTPIGDAVQLFTHNVDQNYEVLDGALFAYGSGFGYFETNPMLPSIDLYSGQQSVRFFETNGSATGGQFSLTPYGEIKGAVTLSDGNILSADFGYYAFTIVSPSGALIAQAPENQFLAVSVAALPQGRFVITSYGFNATAPFGRTPEVQIFNNDGTAATSAIEVDQSTEDLDSANPNPHVAALPDGRFVVSWFRGSGPYDAGLTEARVFNQNGSPATGVIEVPNSPATGIYENLVVALDNTHFSVLSESISGLHAQSFVIQAPPDVHDNFQGVGQSGVLMQNGVSVSDLTLNGTSTPTLQFIGTASSYGVIGTGDYNGDGMTDVLLENGSGGVIDWSVQHGAYNGYAYVGNAAGFGIVGQGDFNGDGTSDVLLENSDRSVIDWIMQKGVYQGYQTVGNAGAYNVVGTGDFNGDGTGDVLLANSGGAVIDWIMNNGVYQSYNAVGNASGYRVVGTGDFNGDGSTDVLLQNQAGDVIDWIMQNGQYTGYNQVGSTAGLSIVAAGDYNGDGTTDVLLQDASHHVIDWTMQNGTLASTATVGNAGSATIKGA